MTVIKLIGLVNGQPHKYDGLYVDAYDPSYSPNGNPLECYLKCTGDPAAAKQFADMQAAMEFCLRVDERNPEDFPGHPNRPIRAFTLDFVPLEMAVEETEPGGLP